MHASMDPGEWVDFIEGNYLGDFIAGGGASIKFAVPMGDGNRGELTVRLNRAAERQRFQCVHVDASTMRFHMIDQVFFAIAKQTPWQALARSYVASQAEKAHYRVPDDPAGSLRDAIAEANETDPGVVLNDLRSRLSRTVYKDPSLTKDFRVAMTSICLSELVGGEEGEERRSAVIQWLTGENRAISAVKPYGIFSRVHRSNARFLLESLFVWVRRAGWKGTLLMLDTLRLTVPRRPPEGVFYTKAMLLDSYEVLRQFVDSTDRLTGCLLVILPGPEFLDIESGGRGMGAYEALRFRIYDEIRDRELANPMAPLMRIDSLVPGAARP